MNVTHIPLLDPHIQQELQTQLSCTQLDSTPPGEWKIDSYLDTFTNWLQSSKLNQITDLGAFKHRAYSNGTCDSIAEFVHRHSKYRRLRFSRAEFVLSKITANNVRCNWEWLEEDQIDRDDAVVISLPFSGNGSMIPDFETLLDTCDQLGVPVLLDLAYYGISFGLDVDLSHRCITDVTCSLSKPVNTFIRCGIRFTRALYDDRIQLLSDLGIVNRQATTVAENVMLKFSSDYIGNTYAERYNKVCNDLDLVKTNTVTLALGRENKHGEFFRNGYYRICITDELLRQPN